MDKLYNCVLVYKNLLDIEYIFNVSKHNERIHIKVDFEKEDFYHLIGYQYLSDLDIPSNKVKAYNDTIKKKITYDFVSKSVNFNKIEDSYADVESRIDCFQLVEEYLDTRNLIVKYVKNKNKYSKIDADFMI
ncbi:PBECR4 domain-containing protein [Anaerosporobacter sp.]